MIFVLLVLKKDCNSVDLEYKLLPSHDERLSTLFLADLVIINSVGANISVSLFCERDGTQYASLSSNEIKTHV